MNALNSTNDKLAARTLSQILTRTQNGSALLELPVSLWISLVLMFVPMLSLGSLTLRSTLFNIAVQQAVQDAAKAKTFEQASADGPDAKTLAKEAFFKVILSFPGLKSTGIDLRIVQTNISNGNSQRFPAKLGIASDTTHFIYQVEGTASGSLDPLLPLSPELFGAIPGLTTPISVQFVARQMAENPQGLNK